MFTYRYYSIILLYHWTKSCPKIFYESSFVQNGQTALSTASASGHVKVVQLLTDAGALVEEQDEVYVYM